MLLQNLRARIGARLNGDSEGGFTLIELLVVMLILGILAAIAIPAFFNQKDKATDASAKSMVRSAETAMETWATDHGGQYINSEGDPPTAAELHDIEPTVSEAKVTVPEATVSTYKVTAQSDIAGHAFSISRNANGETELTCVPNGAEAAGGCPSDGKWGK